MKGTMNQRTGIAAGVLAFLVLTGTTPTDRTRETVLIRPADVTVHDEPDTTLGPYYTISYAWPESLTCSGLNRAILEVFLDASARPRDEFLNASPLFEVYALTEPLTGAFDPGRLERTGRAVRPVALGEARRVVLDVTSIVRAHLEGRIENHGLIIGSLTGERDGAFTLRSGGLPEGAVGRILLFKRMESGRQP
jgi:hypothetical protein